MGEQGIACLEKEMDEVLTSSVPSSWRVNELTPLGGKVPTGVWQLYRIKGFSGYILIA